MNYSMKDVLQALENGLISKEAAIRYAKDIFEFRWPYQTTPVPAKTMEIDF